ncbi:MAG: glycosyltransferase, partial [Acidimicrobiales bacterium]
VPPGDAGALGTALRRVLEDQDLAASLAAAGELRAATFSMDRLAERYVDLYRSAITGTALL